MRTNLIGSDLRRTQRRNLLGHEGETVGTRQGDSGKRSSVDEERIEVGQDSSWEVEDACDVGQDALLPRRHQLHLLVRPGPGASQRQTWRKAPRHCEMEVARAAPASPPL
eukprot:768117-Hanusia_phi.AAC.5